MINPCEDIKLEYKPMLFPSHDNVLNRWNDIDFRLAEDSENNQLLFKVRYRGTSLAFQCYLDLDTVILMEVADTIAATWRTCTLALARHLSNHGDPWFEDNWNLFNTKYLKHIQIESSGYPDHTEFSSMARRFAKVVPNIGEMVACPECDMEESIYYIIMHRNDIHKKSREDIADWLDNLDVDLTVRKEPHELP